VPRVLAMVLLVTACASGAGKADISELAPDWAETFRNGDAAPADCAPSCPADSCGPDGTCAGDGTGPDPAVPDTRGEGADGAVPPKEVVHEADSPVGGDGEAELPSASDLQPEGDDSPPGDCPDAPLDPSAAIQGLIYQDGDQSSCTWYDQGMFPKYDSPLSGTEVRLYGPKGEYSTWSCPEGRFQFDALAQGSYLVDVRVPDADDCTSSNQPKRLPEAVGEGEVTIVTIGDSIAVVGQGPLFPQILAGFLSPLAEIQNHNIAVSGTRTVDWVPGTPLFENKLVPELPGADVLIITLGGNDIMAWVGGSLGSYPDLYAKMLELDDFLAGIHANIVATIEQAKKINPTVDIVFCLYFNYAQSSYWQKYMGSYTELALAATANAWEKARKNVASLPGIVVADMYGAVEGQLLDPYLADSVHLSAKGHQFYAEQVFLALGGALIGPSPLGLNREYGFHLP